MMKHNTSSGYKPYQRLQHGSGLKENLTNYAKIMEGLLSERLVKTKGGNAGIFDVSWSKNGDKIAAAPLRGPSVSSNFECWELEISLFWWNWTLPDSCSSCVY